MCTTHDNSLTVTLKPTVTDGTLACEPKTKRDVSVYCIRILFITKWLQFIIKFFVCNKPVHLACPLKYFDHTSPNESSKNACNLQ